jgi:hypothetical protein
MAGGLLRRVPRIADLLLSGSQGAVGIVDEPDDGPQRFETDHDFSADFRVSRGREHPLRYLEVAAIRPAHGHALLLYGEREHRGAGVGVERIVDRHHRQTYGPMNYCC